MGSTPWEKWLKEKARLEGKKVDEDVSYKRPGQPCTHPPDKCLKEEGKFGVYTVCTLCGNILDGDE